MSAPIEPARAVGISVGLDGDTRVLKAKTAPSSAVLSVLSRHKAGIIALLRPRSRTIRILTAAENSARRPFAPSLSFADILKANGCRDFAADTLRTTAYDAEGSADDNGAAAASVQANPLKSDVWPRRANISHASTPGKNHALGLRAQ